MEKNKLPISQIVPGMRLADPITNSSGMTLMPAGIRLTPMFIARLKKWNIESLNVLVETKRESSISTLVRPSGTTRVRRAIRSDTDALPGVQEEFARAVVREVSAPFVSVRDNEIMMLLRGAVIRRLIQHGRKGVVNILRRLPEYNEEEHADQPGET